LPGCSAKSPGLEVEPIERGDSGAKEDSGDQATCDALEATASNSFYAWAKQNVACSSDTDCAFVSLPEPGSCASPCGALLNETGAASASKVATQDCAQFNAQGCTPPEVGCPATGTPLCAAGTCAGYRLSLGSSGPFTHGACAVFQETYAQPDAPAPAPRDFPLTVTASNGTLYADAACTTPFMSLTLAKGESVVSFGFVPTSAGQFSVTVGGDGGGLSGLAL
jgi:hypothetical protein